MPSFDRLIETVLIDACPSSSPDKWDIVPSPRDATPNTSCGSAYYAGHTRSGRYCKAESNVALKIDIAAVVLVASFLAIVPAGAQQPASSTSTLFTNVRIFDGVGDSLSEASNVLVRDNLIEAISTGSIETDAGTVIIDGAGRTLMPGLIDAHWHAMLIRPTPDLAASCRARSS